MRPFILSILILFVTTNLFAQSFNTGSNAYRVAVNDEGNYMVFQSNLSQGYQLYETSLINNQWTTPTLIKEVSLLFHGLHSMGHVTINGNGNMMVFSARTDENEMYDLFYSVRVNGVWTKPISIKSVNSDLPDVYPTLSVDGNKLFFLRNEFGTDSCMAMYTSTVTVEDEQLSANKILDSLATYPSTFKVNSKYRFDFSKPTKVMSTCVAGLEVFKDNKTIWVRSSKGVDTTYGNFKITSKLPFSYSKKVMQVSSSLDDSKWYISDGKSIQIHMIKPEEHLMGVAYNSKVSFSQTPSDIKPISLVIRGKNNYKDSLVIKDRYSYFAPAVNNDTLYLAYMYPAYQSLYDTLTVTKRQSFVNLSKSFVFNKKKKKYVFNVADSENDKTLSGKVKVVNIETGEEQWLEADPSTKGGYSVYLNEGEEYSIEVTSVKGYSYKNEKIKVGIGGSDQVAVKQNIEVEKLIVGKNFELKNIYYDYNSYTLSDSSAKELNLLLELMEVNPEMKIRIEAHTDSKGNPTYNNELSNKRAQSVVDYLISKGVSIDRLQAIGFGSTQPKVKEVDEATQAQNRRVEIKIQAI